MTTDAYDRLISLERQLGLAPVQAAILRRASELTLPPRQARPGRRSGHQRGHFLLSDNQKSWYLCCVRLDHDQLRPTRQRICEASPDEAAQYLANRTIPERLRALSQPIVEQENAKIRAWIESGEPTKG